MISFYKILNDKLSDSLKKCNYKLDNIIVTESNRKDLGEYQFNGAMSLAKEYKKNPMDIANDIVNVLKNDDFFKDVNVAPPGFINLSISDKGLLDYINTLELTYPKNNKLIFLDYGGANVAKSLHVGHLRSANIGEALKRLCKFLGYNTISDTHLGDWGRPLGLVILELSKRNPNWPFFDPNYKGEYPIVNITNKLLEEIYPYASKKAKEDDVYLEEAHEMTKRLQDHEKGIIALWEQIMDVSKKDIKKIYDILNAEFDLYKGESDASVVVPEMIDYLDSLNIVSESLGAKVIDVSEEDDKLEIPPMLLLKSDGGMLYSTTELATIYDRMKEYKPDEIWYMTDQRQFLHFTQIFRAAKKSKIVNPDTKLEFIGFGTMNGKDGKPFKTRDGDVMRLMDLLSMVKDECLKRLNDSVVEDREKTALDLAIAAIKYADLLPTREIDYIFDISKFCDLEGKTGPYIVYSTIRMNSLLQKSKDEYKDILKIKNEQDREVLLLLNNLDNVLNKAFTSKSLSDITEYLYKLTNAYNRFYADNRVLNEEDEDLRKSWLALTKKVYDVNKLLLDILAINVPNKI